MFVQDKYEIIPKPSSPPKEWKDIDPYLVTKSKPLALYLFMVVPVFLFTLAFATALVGPLFAVLCIAGLVLLVITLLGRRFVADDYALYATWIHETVVPSDEKLELMVKRVAENGQEQYKAKVIDAEGNEEIYDIKTISPKYELGSALSNAVTDAKIYRDPVNHQCVVAQVGQTIVWLWEFTPY